MIQGGNTTIYVADMDVSIRFYTETLGLQLRKRVGEDWAAIDAGPGLVLGLHPANPAYTPEPGTRGSVAIGFYVTQPLEEVVAALGERGISFGGPIQEDEDVRLAFFHDPDGNPLYLAQELRGGDGEAPE